MGPSPCNVLSKHSQEFVRALWPCRHTSQPAPPHTCQVWLCRYHNQLHWAAGLPQQTFSQFPHPQIPMTTHAYVWGGQRRKVTFSPYVVLPFEKKWNHPMEITKQLFSLPCSTCTLSTEPDCGGRQIWVLETMLNSESRDRCLINICGLNEGLRYSLWWWRLYCRIKFIYLFLSFLNGFSTWII